MAKQRIDKLIDDWDPVIQKAFLKSFDNVKDKVQIGQIERMLKEGQIEAAIRAVGLNPADFRPFDLAISNAFEAGGNSTAAVIPTQVNEEGLKVIIQFNVKNQAAQEWLLDRSSNQVTEIINDQKNMIRQYMAAGLERGDNPRTIALDLVGRIGPTGNRSGGIIGLTSSQQEWVANYEDELTSDNPIAALNRTLRDARFDATVRRYADLGEPIPQDLVDKMVTAYTNRALRYRAEAIARTEAMASLHESQQQAIEQAILSGEVDRSAISFAWRTAKDKRVRDSHAEMEGQVVALGEKFVTGNGNELEYPGDPNGAAEDVINCRCWREPQIDFLAGIQ